MDYSIYQTIMQVKYKKFKKIENSVFIKIKNLNFILKKKNQCAIIVVLAFFSI